MKQLLSPDKNNLEKYIVESEGEAEADEGLVIKQKALHCVAVAGRDRPGPGCRGGNTLWKWRTYWPCGGAGLGRTTLPLDPALFWRKLAEETAEGPRLARDC